MLLCWKAETIGWGASSRNGGMVLTGMKLGVNKLISMYGRELTQRMYAASLDTIACVEQIVKEKELNVIFRGAATLRLPASKRTSMTTPGRWRLLRGSSITRCAWCSAPSFRPK